SFIRAKSARTVTTSNPSFARFCRAWLRFASLRDAIDTRAPSRANARAHARPIPLLPPVMTTTFPSNPSFISLSFSGERFLDFGPLLLNGRHRCEFTVGADELGVDLDRFEVSVIGFVQFFLLLICAAQFVPRNGIFGIELDRFREIAFSIGPFLFLHAVKALFIGPARFLWSKGRRKTERVAFDICEALEMNNADFRIVEGA